MLTAIVLLLEYYAPRAHPVPPPLAEHGASAAAHPARWLALARLAFCGGVVGFALLLPLAVIGYWLEQAVSLGRDLGDVWGPAVNSILASTLAAGVAVAAALPVAILAVRYAAGWTRALERLSYSSNALPGIVIALSLVFFGANYAGFAYQTLGLLVFAYVVRFLHQAVASSHSALLRVDPRLEEAARELGKSPRRARHGDGPARRAGSARRRRACLPLDDEGAPGHAPARADRLRHARDRGVDGDDGGRVLGGGATGAPPGRLLGAVRLRAHGPTRSRRRRPG